MLVFLVKEITRFINIKLHEVSYAPAMYGVNVQLK
jgi:hypothetical protein